MVSEEPVCDHQSRLPGEIVRRLEDGRGCDHGQWSHHPVPVVPPPCASVTTLNTSRPARINSWEDNNSGKTSNNRLYGIYRDFDNIKITIFAFYSKTF